MRKAGVVAFAFGVPSTIASNRRIAEIASQKARELGLPVYTQLDVDIDDGIEVEYTDECPDDPPPTLRIARGAAEWAKRNQLDELWVVAAQPHLKRVMRDIRHAIFEIIELEAGDSFSVRICPELRRYTKDSWFRPESTQERTRSRKAWNRREKVLMMMPFCLYKRIAS